MISRIWTNEELNMLAQEYAKGKTNLEISKTLKDRTESAVERALSSARQGHFGEEYVNKFPYRAKKPPTPRKIIPRPYKQLIKKHNPFVPSETLDEAIANANALGMSYGKYIQMKGL